MIDVHKKEKLKFHASCRNASFYDVDYFQLCLLRPCNNQTVHGCKAICQGTTGNGCEEKNKPQKALPHHFLWVWRRCDIIFRQPFFSRSPFVAHLIFVFQSISQIKIGIHEFFSKHLYHSPRTHRLARPCTIPYEMWISNKIAFSESCITNFYFFPGCIQSNKNLSQNCKKKKMYV